MPYNFDTRIDRNGTHSGKWTTFKTPEQEAATSDNYKDYLYFTSADMDFHCSDAIKAAIQKVADFNLYGYTMATTAMSLKCLAPDFSDAYISWFRKRSGWELTPQNIIYTKTALAAASSALLAFTNPGDGVIINQPVYSRFPIVINGAGREVVNSGLKCDENGYYTLDFEDLEKKASDPHNTAYMLCNPQNPVGRVWTEAELLKIYDICRRNHVLLISDEVHSCFIWGENQHKSIAQITGGKGIVTCTGLGKTFNLAALDTGIAIITDEDMIDKYLDYVPLDNALTNPFSIEAVKAACYDSDDWLEQVCSYIDGNIDAALDYMKLHLPKVKCVRPESTYILWMDFRDYGLDDAEIHRRIYDNAKVMLEDGAGFDPVNGVGFQRMCVPCSRSYMLEALSRIAKEFEE